MENNALIVAPRRDRNEIVQQNQAIIELKEQVFKVGLHYGEPYKGADKPTLLKPGAELLCSMFGIRPRYLERTRIEDFDRPLFHYRYECELVDIASGAVVGAGIGSCNSMEDKYGFRWMKEYDVPTDVDKGQLRMRGGAISEPEFAIERGETTGKYGKPAEYWQAFRDAIQNETARAVTKPKRDGGTMRAWEIDGTEYRVPNGDVFSIVNTLDKMAQKRALIAAVLVATGASAYFTQDVEDFAGYAGAIINEDGEVINGKATVHEADHSPISQPKPERPVTRAERNFAEVPEERDVQYETPPAAIDDDRLFNGLTLAEMIDYTIEHSTDIEAGDKFHGGGRLYKSVSGKDGKPVWTPAFFKGLALSVGEAKNLVDAYIANKQQQPALMADKSAEKVAGGPCKGCGDITNRKDLVGEWFCEECAIELAEQAFKDAG